MAGEEWVQSRHSEIAKDVEDSARWARSGDCRRTDLPAKLSARSVEPKSASTVLRLENAKFEYLAGEVVRVDAVPPMLAIASGHLNPGPTSTGQVPGYPLSECRQAAQPARCLAKEHLWEAGIQAWRPSSHRLKVLPSTVQRQIGRGSRLPSGAPPRSSGRSPRQCSRPTGWSTPSTSRLHVERSLPLLVPSVPIPLMVMLLPHGESRAHRQFEIAIDDN